MPEAATPAATPPMNLRVVDHALVAVDLTRLRSVDTPPQEFRRLVARLTTLVLVEVTRRLATREVPVRAPLEETSGSVLRRGIVFVPILRAGLGMLEAALDLVPEATVGHLGIYRNEATREPVPYYRKLPPETATGTAVLLDPMLATGGTACYAIDVVKATRCPQVILAGIVAAPEGIARVAGRHPDVEVYTAVCDRCLDPNGYIRPGLGDAGDRIFGTLAPPP